MKAYDDGQAVIYLGDVRDVLRELPEQSAHTCVTSPPYWGLRDYGTATWDGGDAECKHGIGEREPGDRRASTLGGGVATIAAQDSGVRAARETCGKCGAKRIDRQLGLESTPEEYVANMVDVFREVRRVLRDDGTLWLNIGDSYASGATGRNDTERETPGGRGGSFRGGDRIALAVEKGCKPKDLVGIPWAVATALRDPYYAGQMKKERDRVWLAAVIDSEGSISGFTHDRSDGGGTRTGVNITITNTSANLLAEAHRIWPASRAEHENHGAGHLGGKPSWRWVCNGNENRMMLLREIYPYMIAKRTQALLAYNLCLFMADAKRMGKTPEAPSIHEKRGLLARLISDANQGDGSVDIPSWCIEPPSPTEDGWYLRSDIIWAKPNPMPESVTDRPTKAHEYLFLLSKRERYYYDADAILERAEWAYFGEQTILKDQPGTVKWMTGRGNSKREQEGTRNKRTVWTIATHPYPEAHFATFPEALVEPCILAGSPSGGTVLEPFAGSGTTLAVAKRLGRRAVGIELNESYIDLARKRCAQMGMILEEPA